MDQGGVRVTVGWDGARIIAARVDCHRPQAAQLLAGRTPDEALTLAPRLFSLCGGAQGAAARLALAAAQGEAVAATERTALTLAVAREAIGEHLWRLLLDWPMLAGAAPLRDVYLVWRKRLLAVRADAEAAALAVDLLRALPELPMPEAPETSAPAAGALLPMLSATEWALALPMGPDATFAARPEWQGNAAETGVLARHADDDAVSFLVGAGRRVGARIEARRADLRLLAGGLTAPERLSGWLDSAVLAPGLGLARVETARGLLLHLTQVKDGRVVRYVIVAPTEWNFHPQGAFASEIVGSPAATREAAERLARRLTLALDPCVSHEVVVENA